MVSIQLAARLVNHLNPTMAEKLLGNRWREGVGSSHGLAKWWRARKEAAVARAVDLSSKELAGVSITSSTRKTLRLLWAHFQQVSEVSSDGIYFPTEPEAFTAEVLAQAKEMQCA